MLQLEKERKAREEREKRDAEEAAERQRREEEWVRRNHGEINRARSSGLRTSKSSHHLNLSTFIFVTIALASREKPAEVWEQADGRSRFRVS